jgi:hypothetical protein
MKQPSDKILWLTAFVFGLGLTNYQVLLLAAVPIAVIIALKDLKLFRDTILILIPTLLVMVGAIMTGVAAATAAQEEDLSGGGYDFAEPGPMEFGMRVLLILGVILLVPLSPILNAPVLEPAFAQILPALFGGLGVVFVSRNWKIAIAPVSLMLVLFIAVPALNAGTVGIMVPVSVVFTLITSRIMYKKGWL